MSYVLDGIPTRMEEVWRGYATFTCPCGAEWRVTKTTPANGFVYNGIDADSLRFHYIHCPHAKVPIGDEPE